MDVRRGLSSVWGVLGQSDRRDKISPEPILSYCQTALRWPAFCPLQKPVNLPLSGLLRDWHAFAYTCIPTQPHGHVNEHIH